MFYASTASCYIPCNPDSLKFYGLPDLVVIPPGRFVFFNNSIGVVVNNQLYKVQAIQLAEDGNYQVKIFGEPQLEANFASTTLDQPHFDAFIYGKCPNQHPYDKEGGCLGPLDCPFSG